MIRPGQWRKDMGLLQAEGGKSVQIEESREDIYTDQSVVSNLQGESLVARRGLPTAIILRKYYLVN